MQKISIDLFSQNLYKKIEENDSDLCSQLCSKLFILWFAKFIIFCNYSLRFDKETQKKIHDYITDNSPQDPSLFWSQSSASIYDKAIKIQYPKDKKGFKTIFKTISKTIKGYLLVLNIFLFTVAGYKIVLFCNRRMSSKKVNFFFKENHKKSKLISVRTYPLKMHLAKKEVKNEIEKLILLIQDMALLALSESSSSKLISDNDFLIDEKCIDLAIVNLKDVFPDRLFKRSKIKFKFLQFFSDIFKKYTKITIIDDCAEILRNELLFMIASCDNFNAYGYQHGGQYGEIRSINCAFEITSPVYNLGFLGWGFNLKKANFRKERNDFIGFSRGIKGLLYPKSMNAFHLDNKKEDYFLEKIESTKKNIVTCIESFNDPYWIKSHPKSRDIDIHNLSEKLLVRGQHKPSLDSRSIAFVILDSPGQTIMYDCFDMKVPIIFCFSLSSYNLTEAGYNFYKGLENSNLFINSDIMGFEKTLKAAIDKYYKILVRSYN